MFWIKVTYVDRIEPEYFGHFVSSEIEKCLVVLASRPDVIAAELVAEKS